MSYVEGGLAHRDVSLRNVMVDTSRVPLAGQAEEGAFELRLVDFGSAAIWEEGDSSLTGRYGGARDATADFAPPEMLTDDVAEVAQLRHSPAVDVYAAGAVWVALTVAVAAPLCGFAATALPEAGLPEALVTAACRAPTYELEADAGCPSEDVIIAEVCEEIA